MIERNVMSQPSTEVAMFADKAMFKAEPLRGKDGPRVFLLEAPADPLGQIAAAAKMYKGEVVRDLADVTDKERSEYFDQIRKTKLKAPFEFVKFHFLFENVHRGLTHQLVRQRTAVYAQESMRFAVKDGLAEATHYPPSLRGVPPDDPQRVVWDKTAAAIEEGYAALIGAGMPAEEARGLAPTNIGTRVHYSTDLRALLDHAGNRLCTQAQFEWRVLWVEIVRAIRLYGENKTYRTTLPSTGIVVRRNTLWQWNLIADMFRPVCYLTGQCEFKAMDLDRACKIRDRVDANAAVARPSSEWGAVGEVRGRVLLPISPAEWLLDPSAARVKASSG